MVSDGKIELRSMQSTEKSFALKHARRNPSQLTIEA
jgi:hypothetical protein